MFAPTRNGARLQLEIVSGLVACIEASVACGSPVLSQHGCIFQKMPLPAASFLKGLNLKGWHQICDLCRCLGQHQLCADSLGSQAPVVLGRPVSVALLLGRHSPLPAEHQQIVCP